MPEVWRGVRELNAHLRLPAMRWTQVDHSAFLLLLRLPVPQEKLLPRGYLCPEEDQRAVRANDECSGFFLERVSVAVQSPNQDLCARKNPLTASAVGSRRR